MTKRIISAVTAAMLATCALCGCDNSSEFKATLGTFGTNEYGIYVPNVTIKFEETDPPETSKTEAVTEKEQIVGNGTIPTQFFSGSVDENGLYTNNLLGFQVQIEDSWTLSSEEEYKDSNGMKNVSVDDFKKAIADKDFIKDFQATRLEEQRGSQDLFAVYILGGTLTSSLNNTKNFRDIYFEKLKKNSENIEKTTKNFMGQECYCIEQNDSLYGIYIFLIADKYAGILQIASEYKSSVSYLMNCFTPTETVPAETTPVENKNTGIEFYDDEYVTISYLECEIRNNKEYMVFYVENKTEVELTLQSSSLAINGESLGSVSGSDEIAPMSKGKIRFKTDENFPTFFPDTISGVIRVVDFSRTIFGNNKMLYDVKFINVEVK